MSQDTVVQVYLHRYFPTGDRQSAWLSGRGNNSHMVVVRAQQQQNRTMWEAVALAPDDPLWNTAPGATPTVLTLDRCLGMDVTEDGAREHTRGPYGSWDCSDDNDYHEGGRRYALCEGRSISHSTHSSNNLCNPIHTILQIITHFIN